MLTDYHVHLRPDEPGTGAERYLTAANLDRYRAAAARAGIAELGVSEHIYRFTAALELWRHPFWERSAVDDLDRYCELVAASPLRLGIEADYVPGAEERTARLLDARPFDYVIGSVHFLGDRAVDHPGYDVWEDPAPPERVWTRYFETVAEAARSGLFDILAHPDLVKVWGRARPGYPGDPRQLYEALVRAALDADVAVEVSTAGLRKPVGEIYPAPALLEMLVEADVPLALSSDAHRPEDVGHAYPPLVEQLRARGVRRICRFADRQRTLVELG